MTDFELITDFGNLYKAFKDAKSGKGNKKSTAKFDIRALDGILSIKEMLINKTYELNKYNTFLVHEPKEREIKVAGFKDNVIQHSLCDNVLQPRSKDILIYDNYAGQENKGTDLALNQLSKHLKCFYQQHQTDGYILKCDISKYFYNIPHNLLKDIVEYHFGYDADVLWLCNKFIDSTEDIGLPLGNQVNQMFAILYLDGLDKFITQELGIQFYGRYMDDFYLIHHDLDYLKFCLNSITQFVDTLKLSLNGKTQIFPITNGISFLGFHTYITDSGVIVRRLDNSKKRTAQRKYYRMAILVAEGKLTVEKFRQSYYAWREHIAHGDCHAIGANMDKKINELVGFELVEASAIRAIEKRANKKKRNWK